jgi:DNA repair photolyase
MSLIYEPKGRAREYAALACNIYRGCDHGCTYCYAPSATQTAASEFVLSKPRAGAFLADLTKEAAVMQHNGQSGKQVLLCFTCDPYQTLDARLGHTREAIKMLHENGFAVCTLTKGGSRALRDLDLFTAQDAFATTMTLLDPAQSHTWEPGAALPEDRIATIREFHAVGIPTWISLEPVLDPAQALDIIKLTHTFTDLYKVGKLNHHRHAQTIDWRKWADDSTELLDRLGKRYYVKDDLAVYLTRRPQNALTLAELDIQSVITTKPPEPVQMLMF